MGILSVIVAGVDDWDGWQYCRTYDIRAFRSYRELNGGGGWQWRADHHYGQMYSFKSEPSSLLHPILLASFPMSSQSYFISSWHSKSLTKRKPRMNV